MRKAAFVGWVVLLLMPWAPGDAVGVPQDDAGSGADAPDVRRNALHVSSGRTYEGNLTGPLGDVEDWYALDANAGDLLHIRLWGQRACLRVFDPHGVVQGYPLCRGGPWSGSHEWEVKESGTWYVQASARADQPTVYWFSFGLNRSGPDPADRPLRVVPPVDLPEDDAGTGRDAPDAQSDEVRIGSGIVYHGNLTEVGTTNAQDWYAFEAQAGDQVQIAMAGGHVCATLVDARGSWKSGTMVCGYGTLGTIGTPVTATAAGSWYIRVTGEAGVAYRFSIGLNEPAPDPAVAVSLEQWTPDEPEPLPEPSVANASGPHAVVAVVDTGINPYHAFFRAPSLTDHPSAWLPQFPVDAEAVNLSLGEPNLGAALDADASTWAGLERSRYVEAEDTFVTRLYTFPGTRVVGAVSFGEYADAGVAPAGPYPVLDDHGHGTMTAGMAAGADLTAPDGNVLIVMVEIGDIDSLEDGVRWAARQPWIDAISVSASQLVPITAVDSARGSQAGFEWAALEAAAADKPVLKSAGNGLTRTGGIAPDRCSTLHDNWAGPSWITRIGAAVKDGKPSWWHCVPVDAVAETRVPAPDHASMEGRIVGGGTSAATPNAASHFAHLLLRARAAGIEGPRHDVLQHLLNASRPAEPSVTHGVDPSPHPLSMVGQGYGVMDEDALERAWVRLSAGQGPEPRPDLATWKRAEASVRDALWAPGSPVEGGLWGVIGPVIHNDAGSGRDAPDSPSPSVPVAPGVLYWGNVSAVGEPAPGDGDLYDHADHYAFEGTVGDPLRLWSPACIKVVTPSGAVYDNLCAWGVPIPLEVAFTLPETGTYFVKADGLVLRSTYRFAFTLDGSDPAPEVG